MTDAQFQIGVHGQVEVVRDGTSEVGPDVRGLSGVRLEDPFQRLAVESVHPGLHRSHPRFARQLGKHRTDQLQGGIELGGRPGVISRCQRVQPLVGGRIAAHVEPEHLQRLLDPLDFGLVASAMIAVELANMLAQFGIRVEGVDDVPLRLAKCCRPVSGDPILGYVSLGRGITIHREDCPNAVALRKDPERFVPVSWDGDNETSFKVEIQVDAWDRHRLLEDVARTFAEGGINIVEAYCSVQHPMVKNRFVIEVGDTQALKAAINRLRAIDSVFDAYRVIPSGGG
jgi:hypothetical protein